MNINAAEFPLRRVTTIFCSAAFMSPLAAQAGGKGHAAHEHGVATLNVIAEGTSVTVQLETPAESIYGFEHEAKKPAEVKKRDDAVNKLRNNAEKMFLLDTSLGCKVVNAEVKPFVVEGNDSGSKASNEPKNKKKGTHSEVHATFKFECSKPVAGSALKFAARSQFKALSTLKVQVLSGDKQSGGTIKNDAGTVEL